MGTSSSAPPPAKAREGLLGMVGVLVTFWRGLGYFLLRGSYSSPAAVLEGAPLHAKVHLYALACAVRSWGAPHYASRTFGAELSRRFQGVAIPGTGIPLAWVCASRLVALCFLIWIYPALALLYALCRRLSGAAPSMRSAFAEALLEPRDRLSMWLLNTVLAARHARLTRGRAVGYHREDIFAFQETAERLGIPVAPCHTATSLVVKSRRGDVTGPSTRIFSNAASGGKWIVQEQLENDSFIASILPSGAPLSTLRVVTASRGGGLSGAEADGAIYALSCTFRASRAGALPGEDSNAAILFPVDLGTGLLGPGVFGSRWKRGLRSLAVLRETLEPSIVQHPDCDARVAGRTVPDIADLERLCVDAHRQMAPDVPLAAWEVALSTRGRLLLGVRFGCDFGGPVQMDMQRYLGLVDEYFKFLEHEDIAEEFSRTCLETM